MKSDAALAASFFCYNDDMKDKYTVFFDLDGTLVDDYDTVRPETLVMLETLRSHGHTSFINTGRGLNNIPQKLARAVDGCITVTGASCFYHGNTVFSNPMAEEVINEFASYCLDRKIPLFLENNDKMNAIVPEGCDLHPLTADYLPFVTDVYHSFKEYLEDESFITLKLDTELVYLDQFREELQRLAGKLNGVESGEWYEILVNGNDKGTAIRKTVELLKLDPEKTICVGDSDNDLAMFEACRYGIAVHNASDRIKRVSRYQLGRNTDESLTDVFRQMGLLED